MSYPITQFASDTLTSTKNSPANLPLRLNLVVLLLTGLADVVLFGDLQMCFAELFQHHKVLQKCLEVAKDSLDHELVNKETKLGILVSLWRTFRIVLEKHGNAKAMRNTRETHRLKKEELVKTSCCWFSAEVGLASVTMAFLSKKESLMTENGQIALLFEEIGRVVKAVGLCPASTSQDLSYTYLKETRLALSMIFNETMKCFVSLSSQPSQSSNSHVIEVMAKKCLLNRSS